MKLDYELIEDAFDDTTHIRTMTEQAPVPGGSWLLRTTLYSPHQISHTVIKISASKRKRLFKPIT
jgi:hypothetical protein